MVGRCSSHSRSRSSLSAEAGDLVERRERLVEQQQFGAGDQRPGDRHAHPHAARQLMRIGPFEPGEPDRAQRRRDPVALGSERTRPAIRNGSSTLPATVLHGISVGSWKTKPIWPAGTASPGWSADAAICSCLSSAR